MVLTPAEDVKVIAVFVELEIRGTSKLIFVPPPLGTMKIDAAPSLKVTYAVVADVLEH